MKYTIKSLADLAGVSTRTLRFYDEIGLLRPAHMGENGYRYYGENELLTLQQILFFRELGLPLNEISKIMSADDFDRVSALEQHRDHLQKSLVRTRELLNTIDLTIEKLKGKSEMQPDQFFAGFDREQQEEYEKYLINQYGSLAEAKIDEGKRRTKDWKPDDYEAVKSEYHRIHEALVQAIQSGKKTDNPTVQSLVGEHYAVVCKFWTPSAEAYAGLGQLYIDHQDFRKLYDQYHPHLAEYLASAMSTFAASLPAKS